MKRGQVRVTLGKVLQALDPVDVSATGVGDAIGGVTGIGPMQDCI
jgi:hypothetical protein